MQTLQSDKQGNPAVYSQEDSLVKCHTSLLENSFFISFCMTQLVIKLVLEEGYVLQCFMRQ